MTNSLPSNENKSSDTNVIYVDLDSLLDTRLGALASLKDEYAVNALTSGYTSRDRDEFKDVPYDIFKKAYDKRNVDTLMMSTFTDVFTLLQSCIKSTFEIAATNPNTRPLQIQVNVYPYELSEDEMAEISTAVWCKLKEMVDVNVVNINDAFLTPQYCKDTYTMMIRYDYQSWLKTHHDSHAFEKVKMPEVAIVAPALYQRRPSEQELSELKEQNIHPFTAIEYAMAPFFTLRMTDVAVFCISKEILNANSLVSDNKTDDGINVKEPQSPDIYITQASHASVSAIDPDDGFDVF
jgi:hypothetical protein